MMWLATLLFVIGIITLFIKGGPGERMLAMSIVLLVMAWKLTRHDDEPQDPNVVIYTPTPDPSPSPFPSPSPQPMPLPVPGKFSPSLRMVSVELACERCGRNIHGETTTAGTFSCPRCSLVLDLWVLGEDTHLHRPMYYMRNFVPPGAESRKSAGDDLLYVWSTISTRSKYKRDELVYGDDNDVWQMPESTWRLRTGDCEDKAVLLAQWLIQRGHDARVMLGHTDKEGHAWVSVRENGRDYLLEATREKASRRMPPYASTQTEYKANKQLDRTTMWVLQGRKGDADYRDPQNWLRLPVSSTQ